jgi:hypothetical protein
MQVCEEEEMSAASKACQQLIQHVRGGGQEIFLNACRFVSRRRSDSKKSMPTN